MEETESVEFLQDILECSVCLNSLTQQNKVLPCQHTFCVKCLAEILQTQNELRCPECRILYKEITNLDELPSNILLIRLLEGLKQNMRIKNNRLTKTPNQTPMKQFGKLSVLPHQQNPSLVQRQLMTNKSVLQQLSAVNNVNHHNIYNLPLPILQQQYISPRQLSAASSNNGLPSTANHSTIPPPLPAQYTRHQSHQPNNRRPQLNLENTLVKQPLTQDTLSSTNSNLHQTAPKMIKTPTSSITPNLATSNHTSTSSLMSQNNLNSIVPSINDHHNKQSTMISKPIMCNARALRDSDQIGNWSIKKNDIIFIKEQLNAYWYLAIFNGILGIVPISFVELLPMNTTNAKTLPHSYATLPSNNSNSIAYQSLMNSNNVNSNSLYNNLNKQSPTTTAHATQQAQSIGIQLPLPQQYFNQFTMCRALYDFRVADVNCQNCLSFKKNDLITLIRRVDENWLEGSDAANNVGIFPLTFVEFLPTIRVATRSSSTIPTKVLPTPPIFQSSSKNSTNNLIGNISHGRSNSITNSATTDAMHIRSNSISIINGNSMASPNQLSNGTNNVQQNSSLHHRCNSTANDLITNAFDPSANSQNQFGNLETSSNSCDNLLDTKTPHPNLYVALYNYKPQKPDELELKKNELYIVTERCFDGWLRGKAVKTNLMGVFPGNYLKAAKNKNSQQSSYQNVVANRRSFGNLSTTKFDSADNLLGSTNETINNHLTKPKQLTSSIDNNLSDLNNTMNKMTLNAKSENYLNGQQNNSDQHKNEQQTTTISKSVEQLNNDNSTYENLLGRKIVKKNNSTSNEGSPNQWIQPKVAATRSVNKQKNSHCIKQNQLESPYSFVLNNCDLSSELRIEISTNSNNSTTHVVKEVIHPQKKEEKKSVNLIKMFTSKRSNKINKHKTLSACENVGFIDISPKN